MDLASEEEIKQLLSRDKISYYGGKSIQVEKNTRLG